AIGGSGLFLGEEQGMSSLSPVLQRLIERAQFGEDVSTIEQQILSHSKFHSSIQRSMEVDRARNELMQKGDKATLHHLDQEWDSLQKMSYARASHLKELQNIIEEISKAIMWVNEHEEEELVFDWGDKNIDVYIPKKQESYSKLMRDLEEKEKELNKLKQKVDVLLTSHPASDKIEAYMETLQTQWSWLLQITKCIHVHLKENAAYSQFFKEANETYAKLQKDHESIRKKFSCDKNTPLESLTDLLYNLEREKEKLMENKRQVQTLVNKSKNIVRLKPRSPDEKSSGQVIVQALCDFKQDQKGIMKGNEAILKDNSQRSKWQVTGPGGLDMMIPSVCLIIPPPNPLSITLANKNEQYYEAIMGIWNQLYINIKSLMSWQYCMRDINQINSLTLTMLSKMRPEEYRSIVKSLETHYQEFLRSSHGSEMFGDEDKRKMESQYVGAQTHYDQLVVQLPAYSAMSVVVDMADANTLQMEVVKPVTATVVNTEPVKLEPVKKPPPPPSSTVSITLLSDLSALRRRLEGVELGLGQHLHVPLRDDAPQECSRRLVLLQEIHSDLDSIRNEYLRLREKILQQLDGAKDPEQVRFLRGELEFIDQKLGNLQNFSAVYLKRLTALKALLESLYQAEDIVKVHEARLVEKETTSLDVNDIAKYRNNLKQMKSELEQKKDLLKTMESELVKAVEWNGRIDQSFHQCDVDLSKYGEIVGQMTDRWRRIQTQINTRMGDLEKQERQLKQYQQSSGETSRWIDHTQQRQDELQAAKCKDVQSLKTHIDRQKILFSEIKGKKEDVENVHKDADTCASLIKDYELGLASYSAGLETLLNIPIKRTLLHSPATDITEEATSIQARYIELLTRSSDYYKFLAEMLKNMEELKIRNTKIEILEEELERLKNVLNDKSQKNQTLLDSMSKQEVELTQTKELLVNMEVVKRDHARQCSELKDNLSQNYNSLQNLKDEVTRLTYQIDDEKRKRMLAEERYSNQQKDYEEAVRKRQKELDDLKWAKVDVEKALKDKQHEVERLRMQLQEEAARRQAAESETSKNTMMIHESQTSYNEVRQERDNLLTRIKLLDQEKNKQLKLEDELSRVKVSLESELRFKQRLQEDLGKMTNDFNYWKSQCALKEGQARQFESEKSKADRERSSLQNELDKMKNELRTLEQRYKSQLQSSERQVSELSQKRESLETDIKRLQLRPGGLSKHTQTEEKVAMDKAMTVKGFRGEVSINELVKSNLIDETDLQKLNQGKISSQDIEDRLRPYLYGSTCIAGIYDEANDRIMPIYKAMKEGLLRPGTTLELLEAQAASGFMIDPVNNVSLTVEEAWKRGLVGKEFKGKLLSAERAVTGYKDPHTGKVISLFQAIEKELIERGHGIRLLEAQIASGGIIDPIESHRIDVEVAYKRGYFDREMNEILTYEGDDTKGFFDPNTHENLTYLQLKEKCITDSKTGLILLPLHDKKKSTQQQQSSQKNTLRKRRVVIVDPDTGKEMSVREAYHRELIDYETFLELSEQECEWEEICIKATDGSTRLSIVDRKTGTQYDVQEALDKGIITQTSLDQYRSGSLTLTQFADLITSKSRSGEMSIYSSNAEDITTCRSPTQLNPSSPTIRKRFASVSITLSPPSEILDDQSPVGAIFDTETLEKITIPEAQRRGIVDNITAQRLLEAQACTGGIINPASGERLALQDAVHQAIIDEDMAAKLKPAHKAYTGFEDVKTKRKLSTAEAIKEKWLPYEAGQRFLEFQYLTGGLVDPGTGKRIGIEEAIRRGWVDGRGAQKLQETKNYLKILTCPKTKLKISYKDAMDNCMVEDMGLKMLQATSMSTKGISSPYNVSSGPGSRSGSRTGSRSGSRRGSVDYSSISYSYTSSTSKTFSSGSNS
uniref:Desmoplakin a n=1 Tax=Denticeps clupeoides TaxID=299321 RepID=A0AAY4E2Z1_9TELE